MTEQERMGAAVRRVLTGVAAPSVPRQRSLTDPKFIIAYTIVLGFAGAYIYNPSETMNGALIAAFAGAWGYYLGSSNSSNQVREQVGKALDLAQSVTPTTPPDIVLKPGETAQAEEQL